MKTVLTIAAIACATPSFADLRVEFIEGAPKDRFVVTNIGACALDAAAVTVDLSTSSGAIIFDVTGSGAGVEVFQPLEVTAGEDMLGELPIVADGDTAITLAVAPLAKDQFVAFTIDVDDTVSSRQITVSDAEMAGAEVRYVAEGKTMVGTFNDASVAVVPTPACVS